MDKKQRLQDKLQDMRQRYKTASPSYQKFLLAGAKLLKIQLEQEELPYDKE
jgi:hypothetical protein